MNKISRIIFIVFTISMSFFSCQNPNKISFIGSFGNFMKNIHDDSRTFTDIDWKTADTQFSDFKDVQFPLWENDMTIYEKKIVNDMIGKYRGLQAKRGLFRLKEKVNNIIDQSKIIVNEIPQNTELIK